MTRLDPRLLRVHSIIKPTAEEHQHHYMWRFWNKLAPYGQAARETLASLKLTDAVQPRIVTAENIGQALQFVQSGNAELGFVALGQVQPPDGSRPAGSMWVVPSSLYAPIRQDVVVIAATRVPKAATQFVDYLASDKAREVIKACGYGW